MSAPRTLIRATRAANTLKTTTRTSTLNSARSSFRRAYSSAGPEAAKKSNAGLFAGLALAAGGAGAYVYYQSNGSLLKGSAGETAGLFVPQQEDYQKVYNEIAARLEEKDDYDDGSYGPVLVRLAWHCSGTYDKETKTGGSNGATMRFAPEGDHGANAGLVAARDFLQPIKEKFPWISYSDLWILAGVCAIQEMAGPVIPYRPGRTDKDVAACTPDGRLPDATQGGKHLRDIFGRMGFNDQEIVALSGAHALGRCHNDRSGFEGPWTFSPTILTNDYYRLLLEETWQWKKWNGPKQYEDKKTKSLMMLPTDYVLIKDKGFLPWVKKYAQDNDAFFTDFSKVVTTLFELGVPFAEDTKPFTLKPTNQ